MKITIEMRSISYDLSHMQCEIKCNVYKEGTPAEEMICRTNRGEHVFADPDHFLNGAKKLRDETS